MTNDNTPDQIHQRRKLSTWAARQPIDVQNRAAVIRWQLRILAQTPDSPVLRSVIADNIRLLRTQ